MDITFILIIIGAALSVVLLVSMVLYKRVPKFENFIDNQAAKISDGWKKIFSKQREERSALKKIQNQPVQQQNSSLITNTKSNMNESSEKEPAKNWKEWFATFVGTPLQMYRDAPQNVQQKRWILGSSVFTILLISAVLAGVVYGSIFVGILVALISGCTWFWLMRAIEIPFIVAFDNEWAAQIEDGLRPKRWSKRMLPSILTRVGITLCISGINTIFILMLIFSTEITTQINKTRDAAVAQSMADMNARILPLEQQKEVYQNRYDQLLKNHQDIIAQKRAEIAQMRASQLAQRQTLIGEIEGRVGSGLVGDGPAAGEKRRALKADSIALESLQVELDSTAKAPVPEIDQALADRNKAFAPINKQIENIRTEQAKTAARIQDEKRDGLLDRLFALKQTANDSPLYYLYYLLLLAIEMMPLILKITFGPDMITYMIAAENKKAKAEGFYGQEKKMMTDQIEHEIFMGKGAVSLVENRARNHGDILNAYDVLSTKQKDEFSKLNTSLNDIKDYLAGMQNLSDPERDQLFTKFKQNYILN